MQQKDCDAVLKELIAQMDFDAIRCYMGDNGFTWNIEKKERVPIVQELETRARELIGDAYHTHYPTIASGGFRVTTDIVGSDTRKISIMFLHEKGWIFGEDLKRDPNADSSAEKYRTVVVASATVFYPRG